MANIVIKDLTESVDLDRLAMRAITGGARRGRQYFSTDAIFRSNRIFNYPAGVARNPLTGKNTTSK